MYLRVTKSGSKSWLFRYTLAGKVRDMGLGAYPNLSLKAARKEAASRRELIARDLDPIEERRSSRAAERLARLGTVSFRKCAEDLIALNENAWRNEKHRQQWRNTLKTYAYPTIGEVAVGDVDTTLVLKVLEPIWTSLPETASRVRGRMERILDGAKARGLRSGENPCRWRGHLDALLPARRKVRGVRHHPALPYADMPTFMSLLGSLLGARSGFAARALEFTILTASRTGEALGARWDEIDLDAAIWVVPGVRMKGGREHRVPLSAAAISLLCALQELKLGAFVFPGIKKGMPLSNMALLMLLRDLWPGVTTHGFRSTFKDWCAECTHTPNYVSEAALAHVVADKVEAAYRRSDLLTKRRELMDAWADYCTGVAPNLSAAA